MGKWLENWYCWFLIRWKEGNSYFLYVPIFLVGKILFWKEALEGKSMGKWLENWLRLVVSLGVAIIFWMAKIDVLPGPTQTWDEFQVFLGNFAFGPKVCATSHAPAGARGLRRALSGNHLWYHGMDDFRKFHVGNCMELYIYILYIIYIYIYIFSIIYICILYFMLFIYIYTWSFLSRGIRQNLDEHQDEVRLVGLRDVVFVDASAVALQPILEDVDEDAARMFLESNP